MQHSDAGGGSFDSTVSVPVPFKVQIIDHEVQTTDFKPHTVYIILTWWEGDGEEGREGGGREKGKDFQIFLCVSSQIHVS